MEKIWLLDSIKSLIAATAQVEKLTLVTADKDFKKIKGLKVKLVQF